jgi:hypothetical protein
MIISLADSIAITLNVPVNVLIDGDTIVNIFRSGELPQEWEYHIGSIFLEFEVKNIYNFLRYTISQFIMRREFMRILRSFITPREWMSFYMEIWEVLLEKAIKIIKSSKIP